MTNLPTKENKMGVVPIPKLILTMALPAIFSMLVQALYNVVDSIFVAQISENALTAVSLAFPIQLIVVAAFVGLGIGMNANISRRLGQKNIPGAALVSTHGALFGLVLSGIVALIGIFLSGFYFSLFTNVPSILSDGTRYVQIVTILSVFRIMSQTATSTLQGSGEMVHPMIAQLLGAVANIILDPIMIFGWFGFPALGVPGAAIATILAQFLTMVYIWWWLYKGTSQIKPNFKTFKFDPEISKSIIAIGFPAAIMQGLGSVMLAGVNLIVAPFGVTALAVMGVYYKLQMIVFMPVFGLNTGTLPVVGFNFGAKLFKRLFGAIKFSTSLAIGYMSLCLIIFQFFPLAMLKLFDASPEMISLGIPALKTISFGFPMVAVTIILSGSFNALGKAQTSLFISIVRQLIVLLPISYLLGHFYGVDGIWYGLVIAEVIGVSLTLYLFLRFSKSIIKKGVSNEIN